MVDDGNAGQVRVVNWSRGNLIHDHFDGSANCVQCNGSCKLEDVRLMATELVRWMFERWALNYPGSEPDMMVMSTFEKFGLDVNGAKARALESMKGIKS
jgi:hypothetical protein